MAHDDNDSRKGSSSYRSHSHSSSTAYCDDDDIVHCHRSRGKHRHHKSSKHSVTPNKRNRTETAVLLKTITHFAVAAALVAVLGATAFSLARTNRSLAEDLSHKNDRIKIFVSEENKLKAEVESLRKKCEDLSQENNKLSEKLRAASLQ